MFQLRKVIVAVVLSLSIAKGQAVSHTEVAKDGIAFAYDILHTESGVPGAPSAGETPDLLRYDQELPNRPYYHHVVVPGPNVQDDTFADPYAVFAGSYPESYRRAYPGPAASPVWQAPSSWYDLPPRYSRYYQQ